MKVSKGLKNNGFTVLYQNMKHGQTSSKDLLDFLRESCQVEETYSKLQSKLARAAANSTHVGTFYPFWAVIKTLAEKLAVLHMNLVKTWTDLMKDIVRYAEEQQKKHKAGHHYRCIKCGDNFFQHEWLVRRHLSEYHTGIQYQCRLCTKTFGRNTNRHGCNARVHDFIPMHMESGDKGAKAQERLNRFVREVMPKAWDYVEGRKPRSGDPTPDKRVKSAVAKVVHLKQAKREGYKENQPGKSKETTSSESHRRVEKRSRSITNSPTTTLGEDPQIEVEEGPLFSPPVKIPRTDPTYVSSLEQLTAKARMVAATQGSTAVTETQQSTDTLQIILDQMTRSHSTESDRQAIAEISNLPIVEAFTPLLLEEEEQRKEEEERRREEERQRKEEAERRLKEEKQRKEEEERRLKEEKQRKEEEERRRKEEKQRKEEEGKRLKEEQQRKEEEERQLKEEQQRKEKEKRRLEEEKQRKEEARRQEEAMQRKEEERKLEEEIRQKEEEIRLVQEERQRKEEEKRQEEDRQKREEERRLEEARQRKLEEERQQKEEAKRLAEERKEKESKQAEEKQKREDEIRQEREEEEMKRERKRQKRERKRKQREEQRREEARQEEENQREEIDEDLEPHMTTADVQAQIRERAAEPASDRVTLDVGGRHFATTRQTLLSVPNSIFHTMIKEENDHYFIDRDGGHFRYILNYLRADGNLDIATLPRENRYLIELRTECIYYHLPGLKELVSKRLELYHTLGIAF